MTRLRDGGSYNRDHIGSEHRNFVPFGDSYLGYARSKGYLSLSRVSDLARDHTAKAYDLRGVTVVLSHPHGDPEGSYRQLELFSASSHSTAIGRLRGL